MQSPAPRADDMPEARRRRRARGGLALAVVAHACLAGTSRALLAQGPAPSALRRAATSALRRPAAAVESSRYTLFKGADELTALKAQVLQLGAALDRGQAYNPTSGEYYRETFEIARKKVKELVGMQPRPLPTDLKAIAGEWELVFTTVPHGIFRSSPFFLAVQEAFEYAKEPLAFGQPKANLFFKLHELQTCSWGVSKIGRVAQNIDADQGILYSEFDTSIFSLTVIPILGWFKLLPTFGGCVITVAKASMTDKHVIEMEVDYTTSKPVKGLSGLGSFIWSIKVPVGAVWKLLPWNKGRPANCSVTLKYLDDDMRIVEDIDGELFVYTRPVASRP